MPSRRRFLAFLIAAVVCSAPALGAGRDIVIGASGEVYQVRAGTYGQLFPVGNAAPRAASVLALDVTAPGGATRRLLVPGTESESVESAASLLFEDASGAVYVLWQSRINVIHTLLQLTSYDGKGWSAGIEVSGNPFAAKTAPSMAVTRDVFADTDDDGTVRQRTRTLLHLVWSEEGGDGVDQTFYAPVVMLDGVYQGWNPVWLLNGFDTAAEKATPPGLSELARAPTVALGRDSRTVVLGFTSTTTGRVTIVEVDTLPGELARLADGARAHIIHLGSQASYPANRAALARQAASAVQASAAAFEPEMRALIGVEVERAVLDDQGADLRTVADKARAHIIHLGARFGDRGLRKAGAGRTEEIAETLGDADGPGHLLHLRVAASWPAIHTGLAPRIFVARSGESALVAWLVGSEVRYRQTRGSGWSEVRSLPLGNGLDLARAYEVLEQRVRSF